MDITLQLHTVDCDAELLGRVRIGECLPSSQFARFIVSMIAQLDLKAVDAHYTQAGLFQTISSMMVAACLAASTKSSTLMFSLGA